MDRTLIAETTILDGSGAAPFPGHVLVDIKCLQNQDALLVIMKDGRLHKAPAGKEPRS
jgi:hypothetical protein